MSVVISALPFRILLRRVTSAAAAQANVFLPNPLPWKMVASNLVVGPGLLELRSSIVLFARRWFCALTGLCQGLSWNNMPLGGETGKSSCARFETVVRQPVIADSQRIRRSVFAGVLFAAAYDVETGQLLRGGRK